MGEVVYLLPEWEREPDQNTFEITARCLLFRNKKRRLRKKWAKTGYGLRMERVTLHCVVVRLPYKNLNGYVGVPKRHPWYGVSYYGRELRSIMVHGGLTFSGIGKRFLGSHPFRPRVWYFGFDTAHFMDYVPGLEELLKQVRMSHPEPDSAEMLGHVQALGKSLGIQVMQVYRNMAYVEEQTRQLAEQLIIGQEG